MTCCQVRCESDTEGQRTNKQANSFDNNENWDQWGGGAFWEKVSQRRGGLVSHANDDGGQSQGYCECHVKRELGGWGERVWKKSQHVDGNKKDY